MHAIGQSNFLLALGWAVLNSLWQMAFLWVLYQILTSVFKSLTPAKRSALATGLLFIGFAWCCSSFAMSLADIRLAQALPYEEAFNLHEDQVVGTWLRFLLPLASFVYLVLLLIPILKFVRNYQFVQTIRRYGLSRADVKVRLFVQQMSQRMGIRKPVYIWISDLVTAPVTIGYLRPVVLLPLAAVNYLSIQQIEAVLLHELAHIRRFDYLINLIVRAIQSLMYYNPFVNAFVQHIEREREKSCDDMVMQFQYEPHSYASALLQLQQVNKLAASLTVAASGKKNDLLHRVEWILGVHNKPVFSVQRFAGVCLAILCLVSLNALMLLAAERSHVAAEKPIASISSPLYLFGQESLQTTSFNQTIERQLPSIVHHRPGPLKSSTIRTEYIPAFVTAQPPATNNLSSPYAFASVLGNVMPLLEAQKEAQIDMALEASRKVIAEQQWKLMEKSIADAMTSMEKSEVKAAYSDAIRHTDLSRVNESLRLAYDNIDWNGINVQLNNALAEIKIDSLKSAYSEALINLQALQTEMKAKEITGIPDTEVTLKLVEEKQKEARESMEKLKLLKAKKIIRL